jgi:nitroreductase
MEILEAIKTRRSIRKYKSTPVDERMIETILEAARWAPSWHNNQSWRFVVVRNTEIKNKLAETLIAVDPDRPNRAAEAIKNAPVAIVVCAEVGRSGYSAREPGKPTTDKGEFWYMFDTALAMENLMLAAHSLGLGTVPTGAFDAKKAAQILGVPPGFCVVSIAPLGYPDETPSPRPRKALSEIAFYDRFGSG